jgi:hypothetical protein
LYLKFGENPTILSNDCASNQMGSKQVCQTWPASNATVLHVIVEAYTPYSELTIICVADSSAPDPVVLSSGVPLPNQTITAAGAVQEYRLAPINPGDYGACTLETLSPGDANIYLRFDDNPSYNTFDCAGTNAGTSNEICTTAQAGISTILYIIVEAALPYTNVTITCYAIPARKEPIYLSNGVTLSGQRGIVGVQGYFLEGVNAGVSYLCAFVICGKIFLTFLLPSSTSYLYTDFLFIVLRCE